MTTIAPKAWEEIKERTEYLSAVAYIMCHTDAAPLLPLLIQACTDSLPYVLSLGIFQN
jgi:hypothetical protein